MHPGVCGERLKWSGQKRISTFFLVLTIFVHKAIYRQGVHKTLSVAQIESI